MSENTYTMIRQQYRDGELINSHEYVIDENALALDPYGILDSAGHNDSFRVIRKRDGKWREWRLEWRDDRIYIRQRGGDYVMARYRDGMTTYGDAFLVNKFGVGQTLKEFTGLLLEVSYARPKVQAQTGEIVGYLMMLNCYLVRVDDSLGRWLIVDRHEVIDQLIAPALPAWEFFT